MKKSNELSYKDLKMICNPDLFQFETTNDLEPINTGIGQDRIECPNRKTTQTGFVRTVHPFFKSDYESGIGGVVHTGVAAVVIVASSRQFCACNGGVGHGNYNGGIYVGIKYGNQFH